MNQMSMAWMRMPGQSWTGFAASSLGMWIAMMVAMMLPSVMPALWRFRNAVRGDGTVPAGRLTMLAGSGYLLVWTAVGMFALPLAAALAALEMRAAAPAHAATIGIGVVMLIAGLLQFTAWKAHHLACCRQRPGGARGLPGDASTAWRYGLRLGLHCCYCCAGPTAILLVVGLMDLRAMAAVTLAITAERLAPAGELVARGVGLIIVATGLALTAHAAALL